MHAGANASYPRANSTSTVVKGLRWIFRRDAPLLMNPAPSWHKYSWLGEFVRNITNYRQNTINTTRLAIEARRLLSAIAEREDISFDLDHCPAPDDDGFQQQTKFLSSIKSGPSLQHHRFRS
jgi:hypothetical protein